MSDGTRPEFPCTLVNYGGSVVQIARQYQNQVAPTYDPPVEYVCPTGLKQRDIIKSIIFDSDLAGTGQDPADNRLIAYQVRPSSPAAPSACRSALPSGASVPSPLCGRFPPISSSTAAQRGGLRGCGGAASASVPEAQALGLQLGAQRSAFETRRFAGHQAQ